MKVSVGVLHNMRLAIEPFSSVYIASHSCGLSVQTVNNFRANKTKPSLETYFGICEFIGYQSAYMELAYSECRDYNARYRESVSRDMAAQGRLSPIEE